MDFVERIDAELAKKHITRNKMLADLGMHVSSMYNWQKRGTIPSAATIQKIADYLGVPVAALFGGAEKKSSERMSEDKEELLRLIARMDDDQVRRLTDFVRLILGNKG